MGSASKSQTCLMWSCLESVWVSLLLCIRGRLQSLMCYEVCWTVFMLRLLVGRSISLLEASLFGLGNHLLCPLFYFFILVACQSEGTASLSSSFNSACLSSHWLLFLLTCSSSLLSLILFFSPFSHLRLLSPFLTCSLQ